jgi:hypothetical protein
MQTEFFSQVQSAGASLERGVEGSKAKHQSTKRWAAKQAALGEAIKTSSKAVLQSRVELTRSDLIRPERANLRVSEALGEVVSQREDALVRVEAHKIEFERNKNELAGLRQANNIKSPTAIKFTFDEQTKNATGWTGLSAKVFLADRSEYEPDLFDILPVEMD